MSTRHLVDPEILPILETLPLDGLSAETLPALRAGFTESALLFGEPALPALIRKIDGPGGTLDLYWFDPTPGATNRPALLHIHGGGMVVGKARDMQFGPAGMAAALGIPVVSVEYRLAPETPFPGPQEDCLAALKWLADNAEGLGVDPARLAVIGESAGGGLAAATALMARDTNGPPLAAQFLIYPMLDHRTGGDACAWGNPTTGEFVWTRASNQFGWEALRGDYAPADERKGWFSPALADTLKDLPPTWIGTGSLDLFFDEDLDYARRLVAAGVSVELHSYPGAIHAFNLMAEAAISQSFTRDLMTAINRMLGIGK